MQALKRKTRIRKVVAQVVNRVKDHTKIPVARLALELGYSLPYFRYQVVPLARQMTPCLDVEGEYLVWTCPDKEEASGVVD